MNTVKRIGQLVDNSAININKIVTTIAIITFIEP